MLIAGQRGLAAPSKRGLYAATILVLCLTVLASCGKQQSNVPHGMGPLAPFLDIGTRGMWTGVLKDGVYSLTNTQEPRALRTITLLRTTDAKYSVGVDISFEGTVSGIAGLVFAHNAPEKHYYLLALQPSGRLVLYNRTASSLSIALETKAKLKPGFNRLSFEGEGNSVVIKVNGEKVASHVAQGLSEGGAGIAALGTGTYQFTNFEATGYKRDTAPPPAAQSSSGATPAAPKPN